MPKKEYRSGEHDKVAEGRSPCILSAVSGMEKAASDLLHLKVQSYEPSAHSNLPGSPVFVSVVQREELLRKIAMIDTAAAAIDGGVWQKALIKNACYGVAYDLLDQKQLPTSHRQALYHARMAFYVMIWESR